jgi:DNA-binding IclR family transcriptional regulator
VLESLRRFGHTVALGVLWQGNVSYLFHAPPGIEASHGLGRIGLLPATTSGIGIVLLSEYEDDEVRELYAGRDVPMFPGGVDQLLDKLAEVRRLGYARVHVADDRDMHVVAVSTGDPAHAGVALSGWIPEETTTAIVEALRLAAKEIGG